MTEKLKKAILYRSAHRGVKEADILLGGFVEQYIDEFVPEDLKDLELLLEVNDNDLVNWLFSLGGKPPVKLSQSIIDKLNNFVSRRNV